MLSPWVVEHLDVIEHVLSRLFARFVGPALYPLTLEQVEEAFDDGIVMTVSAAAHRVLDIVGLEERRPVHAGELGALIGMDQHPVPGLAPPHGHQQSLQDNVRCLTALQ